MLTHTDKAGISHSWFTSFPNSGLGTSIPEALLRRVPTRYRFALATTTRFSEVTNPSPI